MLFQIIYDSNPNLRASVPHSGIPVGNLFFLSYSASLISLSGRLESYTFCKSYCKVQLSITSRGSMTFPFDFDILLPFSSLTIGCKKTVLNGSLSQRHKLIMTIRATQKKMMSDPVSKRSPSKNALKSGCSSLGHPIVLKGKRPDENQVSRTSSSCFNQTWSIETLNFFAAFSLASYSFLPTT